jgi:hypothetical protein
MSSLPSMRPPPWIFWAITSQRGPRAGWCRKMKPVCGQGGWEGGYGVGGGGGGHKTCWWVWWGKERGPSAGWCRKMKPVWGQARGGVGREGTCGWVGVVGQTAGSRAGWCRKMKPVWGKAGGMARGGGGETRHVGGCGGASRGGQVLGGAGR